MRYPAIILLCLLMLHPFGYKVSAEKRDTIYACDGDIVVYKGRNYTAGTYTVRQTGEENIILTVLKADKYSLTTENTIFRGDSFVYQGASRTFNSTGTFKWTDSLTSVHGCDSVINRTLNVIARPTTYAVFDAHICAGDSVEVAGRWYKTAGSNSVTLKAGNYMGGDSVVTFNVYVHEPVEVTYYATINQGEARQWYFHRFSNLPPGIHKLTSGNLLRSVYGCDSVEIMYVTVLPVTYGADTLHLCEGDEAEYNNRTYSKSGVFEYKLKNTQGGDSVLTLTVLVHPVYNIHTDIAITYGETVYVGDTAYTNLIPQNYDFTRMMHTVSGCDSIINASVTVGKTAQILTFINHLPDTVRAGQILDIRAEASSGLPVEYSLSEDTENKAELTGVHLYTLASGYATLIVKQAGDMYYEAAKSLVKRFVILRSTDISEIVSDGKKASKELINGNLYIRQGNILYNAAGIPMRKISR